MTLNSCDLKQWESIVHDRTNEVTQERRAFEYELYDRHDNLVRNWVRLLIPQTLRRRIDCDQLKRMILLELLEKLRDRVAEVHIDRSDTIPLCWTIAEHHIKNSVRDARRLKRDGLSEFAELETVEDIPDRKESNRPDKIVGANDLRTTISNCLDPLTQRVLELINLKTPYQEIAAMLGVTKKVLGGVRKVIATTTRRIIDKSDQPSTLNPQQKGIRIDQLVSTVLRKFPFFRQVASAFGAY